jgi:hypothetical protein
MGDESKRVRIVLDDDMVTGPTTRSRTTLKSSDYLDYLSPADNELNIVQQRIYITTNAKYLTKEDHIELGRIFEERGQSRLLKENSDGLRANIDNTTDSTLIKLLYACTKYKLTRK